LSLGQIYLLPLKSTPHTMTRAERALACAGLRGPSSAAKQRGPSPHGEAKGSSGPARTLRRRRRGGRRRGGEVVDAMAGGGRLSLRMPRWRRGQAPWQGGAKGRSRRALRPCLPSIWSRGARRRKPPEGEEPRRRCSISLPREGGEGAAPPVLAAALGHRDARRRKPPEGELQRPHGWGPGCWPNQNGVW